MKKKKINLRLTKKEARKFISKKKLIKKYKMLKKILLAEIIRNKAQKSRFLADKNRYIKIKNFLRLNFCKRDNLIEYFINLGNLDLKDFKIFNEFEGHITSELVILYKNLALVIEYSYYENNLIIDNYDIEVLKKKIKFGGEK